MADVKRLDLDTLFAEVGEHCQGSLSSVDCLGEIRRRVDLVMGRATAAVRLYKERVGKGGWHHSITELDAVVNEAEGEEA